MKGWKVEVSLMLLGHPGISEVFMTRRRNKSDAYQYRIVEISVDPALLSEFPLIESLGAQLNLAKHSERFDELRSQLIEEVLRLVKTGLTERQSEVVQLRLMGKTQIQIAEELGVHQTTVHKLISGNIDYKNGKKRYGGAIKKLRKLCDRDENIQLILEEMEELRTHEIVEFNQESKWDEGFDD